MTELHGAERYWEGRWRDEAKANDRLRQLLLDMLKRHGCDCLKCRAAMRELDIPPRDARDQPFDPGPEAA